MKLRNCLILLICGVTVNTLAQPPNDNFANRTILTGTDVTFDGTLAGATREHSPFEICSPYDNSFNQTIWWDWTAPQNSTVIIEILSPSKASSGADALQVYVLQDIFTGTSKGARLIATRFPHNFVTFTALSGTSYQIQLAGNNSAAYTFHLVATNTPLILDPPQTQTVTAGDSALFSVVVTGAKPFGYQWQFNGTNLDGETYPILGLDHLATDQAGQYQVIVTNASGAVTSSATLFVTATDAAATLAAQAVTTNTFAFQLLGEPGRRYRIQSSTNLFDWTPEISFPTIFTNWNNPNSTQLKSVVLDPTGSDSFTVPRGAPAKFYRATAFHAVNEECNNDLKLLRAAQLLFAFNTSASENTTVSVSDLIPYLRPTNGLPRMYCPTGAHFLISTVLNNPVCPNHPFEER